MLGGGHQKDLTTGWPMTWIQAVGGSPSPLLSWNVHPACFSHSGSHFQGYSLQRARCCWDYLGGMWDWTHSRPLYGLLRFWWVGVEILSCGSPTILTTLAVHWLFIETATCQSGRSLRFALSLPCMEPVYKTIGSCIARGVGLILSVQ